MDRPFISFLTDFGLDGAAAVCRGVMLSICRDAQIVDVSHTLRKYAIADGAYLLSWSLPYMPVGVHVAVVDPGVGTARRPIALKVARGDVLVGPDNGLLSGGPAEGLGGIVEARVLENRDYWLPGTVSSTFHGRDIFSPVAAHLAAGDATFDSLGSRIEIASLVRLDPPRPTISDGLLQSPVTYVDSFGNLRLAGGAVELAEALGELKGGEPLRFELEADDGDRSHVEATQYVQTFGEVAAGQSLVYVDSSGNIAVADNQGNIAARLGVRAGRTVRITRS
jgi:S-adenosylmethionine hydrolase